MKEEFNKSRKYMLIIIFIFFTLPIVIMFMPDGIKESLIFGYLYALNPIVVFAVSFMYAVRYGYDWKFPLIVGAVFIPAVIIYFELQNIVFAVTYCIFSFIGVALGTLVKRFL